jgi:outer membrane protein assembly factor BamB
MRLIQALLLAFIGTALLSCGANNAGFTEGQSTGGNTNSRLDWPKWRGPDNDGISKGSDWDPMLLKGVDNLIVNNNPLVKWKQKIGRGYSGIAVVGKYLYTMGYLRGKSATWGLDIVYCLDVETGKEVWTLTYPCSLPEYAGPRATPLVDEGKVYTLSHDGQLYCLDAGSGAVFWFVDVEKKFGYKKRTPPEEFGFCMPPAIDKDILLINAHESGIALNKRTGEALWSSANEVAGYATPVFFQYDGKTYAAIFAGSKLYVVVAETGVIYASYDWPTPYESNFADPVVKDGTIFISSSYDMGYARFRLEKNKLVPIYKVTGKGQIGHQMGPGVLIGNYYYSNENWYVYHRPEYRCINFETGEIMWRLPTAQGSVCAIGDKLLFLNENGRLAVVEPRPDKYTEIVSCNLGRKTNGQWFTLPTFVRSQLFLRDYEGDIFCLDLAKKK